MRLVKALTPTVCSGGVFVYAGRTKEYKGVEGFVGYLGEYDTKSGWSNNALFEGGGAKASGGVAVDKNLSFNPFLFVPLAKYGGLVLAPTGGGFYAGTPAVGVGAYLTVSSMQSCE
jgi:hypothetical protein